MTNEKKAKDLSVKQVQAINTATAGVFNGLQQAALLKALHAALNPQLHEDTEQADAEDAKARALREEKEQAQHNADAVKRAQAEAKALDEAKAHPNVLNQGNYDQVVESTREAVKARDPEVVKEDLAEGRDRRGVGTANKADSKKVK